MVKFGKELKRQQKEEWRDYYIHYSMLKKLLEDSIPKKIGNSDDENLSIKLTNEELEGISTKFLFLLDSEIENIVLFYLSKEGELADSLRRIMNHLDTKQISSESLSSSEVTELDDELARIGYEIVDLTYYLHLNVTGIRKILKKHDKNIRKFQLAAEYLSHRTTEPDSQLLQLYHHEGISALTGTLRHCYEKLKNVFGGSFSYQFALSDEDVFFEITHAKVSCLVYLILRIGEMDDQPLFLFC